jgi:hypothetical protein
MVFCLFYILYRCINRSYDWTLFAAMGVILIDGLSIVFNHGRCPLTTLAERHGAENGAVTDIFLPVWCARYVFKFFTVLFAAEAIWLGFGYLLLGL